jgi:hypothetical protein
MSIKESVRKVFGNYLIGFHVASDKAADTAKRGIEVVHATACSLTPMILSYRTIEKFEKSRDKYMVKVHSYAHCTRCKGKGYLKVMSVGGEYVGNEPCPQCTIEGYQRMIGKEKGMRKKASAHSLPEDTKKETAIRVFDRMMDKARQEKVIPVIYCSQCKGQRMIHSRDEKGKYIGQKRCSHCSGTGKDYKSMSLELIERCMKTHLEKGYSDEDAWSICMISCFDQESRQTDMSLTEAKTMVTP